MITKAGPEWPRFSRVSGRKRWPERMASAPQTSTTLTIT